MCDDDRLEAFKTLMHKWLPPDIKYPIEHDALTEDGTPVLFCCLLNIPRLFRFNNGLILHRKIGKVIAFDFQLEMLERYLGDRAEVMVFCFKEVMEWLFPGE